MKKSYVRKICILAFAVNFVLFGVKLYIGLSTNSIGIFSDSVNNLFDSLSGMLTFVCLTAAIRSKDLSSAALVGKTEQLCSFIMAIAITFTGLYFAYTSLERFMYPTAVWFTPLYAGVLLGTAAVKLLAFFYLRTLAKKEKSSVAKLMMTDCVLDFGITMVTALTLYVSYKGTYAVDAAAGLAISAVIVVSAVKSVISAGGNLINRVPVKNREAFRLALKNSGLEESVSSVRFITEDGGIIALLTVSCDYADNTAEEITSASGINTIIVKG